LVPMHFSFFEVAVAANHPEVRKGHGKPWILRSREFMIDGFATPLREAIFADGTMRIRMGIHPGFTFGSGATFVVTALITPVVKLAIILEILLSKSIVSFSSDFISELKQFF
jgi:hypothetical protein